MMILLTLIPWVLTVAGLLFIMINNRPRLEDDEDMFEDGNSVIIRAAVYEDKAYWVHDNVFYESEVTREPDWQTATAIDTAELSPKDLSKLLKILDDLEKSGKE